MSLAEQPDAAEHFLGVIQRKIERLEQMVSDLLDLSRIESSSSRFVPEALELARFLADLQSRFKERFEARQIDWHIDLQPDLQRISANPYLLRIATDNLLDNAIKFTEPGGRVEVNCRSVLDPATGRRQVAITVSDDGCGIDEQEQKRVFERFYQVAKARTGTSRGTGLGLSIVRHAVATMNGSVSLESELGQGTRVTILLPLNL